MAVVEIPDKARRVLPAPDEIEQIEDDILVALAYEVFELLPAPKKALGEKAHDRITILTLLKQNYASLLNKTNFLDHCLIQILDPRDTDLVLASSFSDGFPFILRLVQVREFAVRCS